MLERIEFTSNQFMQGIGNHFGLKNTNLRLNLEIKV